MLAGLVSLTLAAQTPGGQAPAAAAGAPGSAPNRQGPLRIIVLVGDGAVHRIPLRLFTDPVVEVRDSNDLPVEGATVVFTLPAEGPSGTFSGQRAVTARSDAAGQAGAYGFASNQTAGKFVIDVKATLGDRQGQASIRQTNSMQAIASTIDKPKSKVKKWLLISGIAAGALVATLLATRGGTPAPVPPTVVLRPGTISVGGPR